MEIPVCSVSVVRCPSFFFYFCEFPGIQYFEEYFDLREILPEGVIAFQVIKTFLT